METRLKKVIAAVFGIKTSEVNDELSVDTLGNWDSMQHIVLMTAIEEEFGVEFTSDEVVEMSTYPLVKITLEEKLSGPKK